jgi:tRNA (cytidine/uridine-2'-O-)-methyltransferase
MPLHVVLFEPEIPPNTGNVIRLCANTGACLHLVGRLGFRLDARSVRRAGLDYHELADVHTHADLPSCLASLTAGGADLTPPRWFALTTRGEVSYDAVSYREDDVFVFGPETRGLPDAVLAECSPEHRLRLPMQAGARSLNLSNCAAVVVYEAWRQLEWR